MSRCEADDLFHPVAARAVFSGPIARAVAGPVQARGFFEGGDGCPPSDVPANAWVDHAGNLIVDADGNQFVFANP